jgi:hypothetical protein
MESHDSHRHELICSRCDGPSSRCLQYVDSTTAKVCPQGLDANARKDQDPLSGCRWCFQVVLLFCTYRTSVSHRSCVVPPVVAADSLIVTIVFVDDIALLSAKPLHPRATILQRISNNIMLNLPESSLRLRVAWTVSHS